MRNQKFTTNTFSNQIFDLTREELLCFISMEENRIEEERLSNRSKQLEALRLLTQIVNTLADEVSIRVEGTRGNNDIRDFPFVNMGSVVESVVKSHLKKGSKRYSKTFGDEYDVHWSNWKTEIKAGLSGSSKPTRTRKPETTILVNRHGAFLIKKGDVMQYRDSQGKLPYRTAVGRRLQKLSRELGYN